VIRDFSNILRTYGIAEIVSDNFAAGFCSDEWVRNGIRFKACDNTTAENFLCTLPLLTSKRSRLVDDVTLRKQLSGLQRRVVGGHETVGHQQIASAHDDVAAACAGVLALIAGKRPAFVVDEQYLREATAASRAYALQRMHATAEFWAMALSATLDGGIAR
jgi:hypothetical protein